MNDQKNSDFDELIKITDKEIFIQKKSYFNIDRLIPKNLFYRKNSSQQGRCGLLLFYNGLVINLLLMGIIFYINFIVINNHHFYIISEASKQHEVVLYCGLIICSVIICILLAMCMASLVESRSLDLNISHKWRILSIFIPPIALILLVSALIIPGKNKDNQYGLPAPRGYPIGLFLVLIYIIVFIYRFFL